MGKIAIKGTREGIKVYTDSCDCSQVKAELLEKIERGRDFFTGSNIYIVDEKKTLSPECFEELETFFKKRFNISVSRYKTTLEDETEKKEKVFGGIYEGRTKFLKNTVRSGQRIAYNGNVVIIGDVNSGAEIIANGNIIVLGVLRGMAHAGYNGNQKAVVAAYALLPSQLRISNVISRSPDEYVERPAVPEVARIKDDIIIIEPYLPNKYL